jgi:hypothetical protein
LFQDRFKSEPVEDEKYFFTVLRYIFQNPLRAGIVSEIQSYAWTNYIDYIEGINRSDIDYALDILNTDREKAKRSFVDFINNENDDECLDVKEKKQLTDDDAKKIIRQHCKIDHAIDLQTCEIDKRNSYIKELKVIYGLSVRQIERLTGINRGIIQRV